jgi:YD repeat-containing protein
MHNPDGDEITLVRYRYNDVGRLVEIVNSSNRPMLFEYDLAGRITRWQDRNGEWYRYNYDADGRVVRPGMTEVPTRAHLDYRERRNPRTACHRTRWVAGRE